MEDSEFLTLILTHAGDPNYISTQVRRAANIRLFSFLNGFYRELLETTQMTPEFQA